MKHILLFLISSIALSAIAQKSLTTDSLEKRIRVLEKNQTIIVQTFRDSGKDLQIGLVLAGSGMLAAIAGGLLSAFARPDAPGAGFYPNSRITGLQIGGILFGSGGLAAMIIGLHRIGNTGQRLRDL